MPAGKQAVSPFATLRSTLREKVPYWFSLALLIGAGVWGLVQFRSPSEGVADIPLTPGETLGIHVTGRTPAFETIVEAARDGSLFQPFDPRSDLFTGSSKIHAWIRLPLTNPDSEERTYVLQMNYQWIDLATLYTPDGAGGFRVQEQGKVQHYSAAKSAPLGPAFAFTLGPHESQVLFLKLQESHWLQPSFTLWKNLDAFQQRVLDVNRFVHTYLGLMAGLFLANLCALIAFRYRDLIYYLLFLVATSALHCSNFNLFTVYRPDWIRPNSILMSPAFDLARFDGLLLITSGLLLLFANDFLKVRAMSVRLEKSVLAIAGFLLVLGPLVMFGPLNLLGHAVRIPVAVLWSFSNLLALGLGIAALLRDPRQARFFVPSILLLVVVSSRFIWSAVTGQIVVTEVLHQWVFASSLEMIGLSIGLVDRFMLVVKEKETAQSRALEAARNHANLQQRFNAELAANVEQKTADLNRALHQKNRLIAYLAHDMRMPLHGLVSLSSMLAKNPAKIAPDEVRSYATEIEGGARGVSELMENLLSWARLQTGDFQLHQQEYLVADIFEAATQHVRTQALLKNIRIDSRALPDCFVHGDFTAIVTVLRNLLSNAIKFSPPDLTVVLRAEDSSAQVTFFVEDHGPGLPSKILAATPAHDSRHENNGHGENGSGLGLGICRNLLQLHNSQLHFTNRNSGGARFSFSLPKA